MRIGKQLAVVLAAAATLVGTSAFAESRPSNGTRSRGESGNIQRRERSAPRVEGRSESRRGNDSSSARRSEGRIERRSETGSSGCRVEVGAQRSDRGNRGDRTWAGRAADRSPARTEIHRRDRADNRRHDGNWRSDNRHRDGRSYGNRDRHHGNRGGSYGNRTPYYHHGRVSQVHRYGSGYRVWIGGAPYPYFIPAAYYHSGRFRVGLSIGLGGYYNPLGYYDYYDAARYDTRRGDSDGVLRGVVESVDYRRDTFVIRNEATGSFVTVEMRDRRRDDLRAGDYVEISGDWSRSGVFQAYDVDFLDDDRR
ncbi:MAG: hypothetical protein ABIO78_02040 [Thermoanaerobaculia bacterium]